MRPPVVHGIGAAGRLVVGEFAESRGQWTLQLDDGTVRPFGAVTSDSVEIIGSLGMLQLPMTSSVVATAATEALVSTSSVILEATPFCAAGCHTCIASSVPTRIGELTVVEGRSRLSALRRSAMVPSDAAVMISGGEPTEHPEFFSLVSSPEFLRFRSRYVITHGSRFMDIEFATRFSDASPGTQLYLQYDSFDADHLRLIRGSDLTHVRKTAIHNCEAAGIAYTLVCVVLCNVNDTIAAEIVDRHIGAPHCTGVTFQPIKFVGRSAAARDEHRLTTFDLVLRLEDRLQRNWGIRLAPHPANPLNWAIGYTDGVSPTMPVLYEERTAKRVAVVWHTDPENYVIESVGRYPITFAERTRIVPLEVHYGAV